MQAFYGEWRKDEATSPIWDISTFIGLLNWSSSLQSFMKTGHGAGLATLARQENAAIQKSGQGERPRTLASLAESIRAFSDNISTVRVPQIITGKERGSASDVLAKITQSEAEVRTHFMPLFPVLEQLKAKLQAIPADSLFSPQGHQAMLELAKLYVSYERYPEAAIVLREGWISLHAETQGADEQQLKSEARHNTENRWNAAEGKDSAERIADQIRNVRNDIQHGGFKEKDARNPATSLIRDLQALLDKFEAKLNLPTPQFSTPPPSSPHC
jgi:CRISPR-associated protein Csx16